MVNCEKCGGEDFIKQGTYKGIQKYKCKGCNKVISMKKDNIDPIDILKKNQALQDKNRVANKVSRESFRKDNTLIELNTALLEKLDLIREDFFIHETKCIPETKGHPIGMLQLSDLHFGEKVVSEFNNYDWEIAGKRLKKFVNKASIKFIDANVQKVVLCLTGDMFNSPRRLDELMTNSHNIMQSLLLGMSMISQVIKDLTDEWGFTVDVVSIVGNESRIDKEYGFSEKLLTNNLDYSLECMLNYLFAKDTRVNFIPGGNAEKVIDINGKHILVTHGTTFGMNPGLAVQKVIAKYSMQGINLDYVIFGHIHCTLISDFYARSASLVGSNAYSDKGLNLASEASQNMYIVGEDIEAVRINLQNYTKEGYDVRGEPAYCNLPKEEGVTIFKIVI